MADSRRRLTLHEVAQTIADRSIPEPNSGCLLWEGPLNHVSWGYGGIMLRGRYKGVHRVAYEAAHGPIPKGMQVLHRCDVRICSNLDHLFLGTNNDNHADKAAKDRGKKRLTHAKALEIHRLTALGHSHCAVARKFDVNQSTVSRIVAGKRRSAAFLAAR